MRAVFCSTPTLPVIEDRLLRAPTLRQPFITTEGNISWDTIGAPSFASRRVKGVCISIVTDYVMTARSHRTGRHVSSYRAAFRAPLWHCTEVQRSRFHDDLQVSVDERCQQQVSLPKEPDNPSVSQVYVPYIHLQYSTLAQKNLRMWQLPTVGAQRCESSIYHVPRASREIQTDIVNTAPDAPAFPAVYVWFPPRRHHPCFPERAILLPSTLIKYIFPPSDRDEVVRDSGTCAANANV